MASPHASSFICLPYADDEDVATAYLIYYSICLASAVIGAIGAFILLGQVCCGATRRAVSRSQRNILAHLAIADLLADLGVIGRSLLFILYWHSNQMGRLSEITVPAIAGIVLENWVSFWYLATYFWTFFFAVDIYNSKYQGRWCLCCSHFITWGYCVLLVLASVTALWVFSPLFECTVDALMIVSHFCCTLGPIIIFMLAIPIFYLSTLKKMEEIFREGLVIEARRREKNEARKKVIVFILVFYICWSVNVLDGVLLITTHLLQYTNVAIGNKLYTVLYDPKYIYVVWSIEAVMNPLQGLFNALVYSNTITAAKKLCILVKTRLSLRGAMGTSWSGEFIDVDFRNGPGKIEHAQRRKNHTG